MNGYFSQLMQQSGVAVATERSAPLEQQVTEVGTEVGLEDHQWVALELAPAEDVEERPRVAPDYPVPPPASPPTQAAAPSVRSTSIAPTVPPELSTSVPISPDLPSPPSPRPFLKTADPAIERVEQIQLAAEVTPSELLLPPEPPHSPEQQSISTPLLASQPSPLEQDIQVEAPLPLSDIPRTPQAYLQAVWNWVSVNPTQSNPPARSLEQEVVEMPPRMEQPQEWERSPFPTNAPPPIHAQPNSPSSQLTQDLHLSIGSITVTLESPSPPPSPPLPVPPSPRPSVSSLHRHYLRLR